MTRYYYQAEPSIEGGKVKWGKVGKDIAKDFKKTGEVFKDTGKNIKKGAEIGGKEIKKGWKDATPVLMHDVLPAAVSMGIPITSAAFGALATAYGGPAAGMLAQQMTQNALQAGIPDKYQSDNKWVNMAGQMAGTMASIGMAPTIGPDDIPMQSNPYHMAMAETMGNLSSNMANQDYSHKSKGKSKQYETYDNYNYYANPTYSSYSNSGPRPVYNPNDPYADLMHQIMNKYTPSTPEVSTKPEAPNGPKAEPIETNDAIYKRGQLDDEADNLMISQPPYQQKEGSVNGLLGGKLITDYDPTEPKKRRRGRPKKSTEIIEEVYIKKKLPHKKFSHADNPALDQLLEATGDREEIESKKAMKKMIEKQTRALEALGFGLRPSKGSQEAKDKMARLRAMRKSKK